MWAFKQEQLQRQRKGRLNRYKFETVTHVDIWQTKNCTNVRPARVAPAARFLFLIQPIIICVVVVAVVLACQGA